MNGGINRRFRDSFPARGFGGNIIGTDRKENPKMPIRNSVKAVLLRDGKILCNRCAGESGAEYYALPGGGQRPFESMEEALAREVLEETGLTARAGRLLAVAEEIDCRVKARDFPEYAHRIQHIFLAEPAGEGEAVPPAERDYGQTASVWLPLEEADRLPFRPGLLAGKISALAAGKLPFFLGTARIQD